MDSFVFLSFLAFLMVWVLGFGCFFFPKVGNACSKKIDALLELVIYNESELQINLHFSGFFSSNIQKFHFIIILETKREYF